MPHYVTKLGEKNYWRKLRSVRVFFKNCASIFFGALAKEWLLKCKTSFLPPNQDMLCFTTLEINEMKQTKNWL
jgi:hypothetical protein